MTDTNILFAKTDISVSVSAKYIGQPIYRSNPNFLQTKLSPISSIPSHPAYKLTSRPGCGKTVFTCEQWKLFNVRDVSDTLTQVSSLLKENMCFLCSISYLHPPHICRNIVKEQLMLPNETCSCVSPSFLTILPPDLPWHTGGNGGNKTCEPGNIYWHRK